jgi:hypothetical protein
LKRVLEPLLLFAALAWSVALAGSELLVVPTAAGPWRGVLDPPGALRIALAILVGVSGAWVARRRPGLARPFLVLLAGFLPLVPLATGRAAVLLLFQGPVVLVLAVAAAGAALTRSGWRPSLGAAAPFVVFACAFAFDAALTAGLPGAAGPQGDEPHYLVMAESLRSDRDLDLRDEHEGRAYRAFYHGKLVPHRSPASPPGRIYSIHAPGLPLIVLPGYALLGFFGAQLTIALLAALAVSLVFVVVRDATGDAGMALAAAAALGLAPPFPFYAVSLYPEAGGALAVAFFLWAARSDPGPARLMAAGVVAAALPWLHPKFLPLAALGLALVVVRRGSRPARAGAVALFAAGVCALLGLFHALYGRASLSAAYGSGFASDVALGHIPTGLGGLLLDRQFGLLPLAPFWLLALPGAVWLFRWRPGDAMRAILLAAVPFAVGASFSMWWGGSCPPARFAVPALPALAVLAALALRRRPALAFGLAGAALAVTLIATTAPRAIHNRPDGESALLKVLAPAVSVDALLPSFVPDADAPRSGLHERRASLELLRAWGVRRIVTVAGALRLEDLSLPVPLDGGTGTLRDAEARSSRRLEGPAGVYRLTVSAQVPDGSALRLRLADGHDVVAQGTLRAGRAPFEPRVTLGGRHGRRLVLHATAVGPGVVVSDVRLHPLELLRARR